MKNSIKLAVAALAIGGTVAGITAVALNEPQIQIYASVAAPSYQSCSYLNFGIDTINATATNVMATAYYNYVALPDGATGSNAGVSASAGEFDCAPLKMGTAKKSGNITFTVNDNYSMCYIWAAAWKGNPCDVTINESTVTIDADEAVTGNDSGENQVNFTKYQFNNLQSADKQLTITSAKRVLIGAIALYK